MLNIAMIHKLSEINVLVAFIRYVEDFFEIIICSNSLNSKIFISRREISRVVRKPAFLHMRKQRRRSASR